MKRVAPSTTLKQQIAQVLQPGLHLADHDPAGALVQLAARLVLQEALESEQADFVGRGRYQRGERQGYRNGYEPGHLDTAEGRLEVRVPQVRGTEEPYRSKLLGFLGDHTEVLDKLATEMYARGLSCRDVEEAFTDATGTCLLSRSAVSEVTDTLWAEYEAFAERDLSAYRVAYLFCDGIYESLREQAAVKEAVLVAWGICDDGTKMLLHLGLGSKESHDDWLAFFRSMQRRGLREPLSVTSDGAPGLIRAIEEAFPRSLRLRCWFHKMRNVLAKVPDSAREEVRAHLRGVRDSATLAAGQQAAAEFIGRFGSELPSAVKSFEDDLDASLTHLKLPADHRVFGRTTNLVERSFVEERRRTKVIPRFFNERSCLKLVFGTLIRVARRWSRVRVTALHLVQWARLRQELGQTPPTAEGHATKAAA